MNEMMVCPVCGDPVWNNLTHRCAPVGAQRRQRVVAAARRYCTVEAATQATREAYDELTAALNDFLREDEPDDFIQAVALYVQSDCITEEDYWAFENAVLAERGG